MAATRSASTALFRLDFIPPNAGSARFDSTTLYRRVPARYLIYELYTSQLQHHLNFDTIDFEAVLAIGRAYAFTAPPAEPFLI